MYVVIAAVAALTGITAIRYISSVIWLISVVMCFRHMSAFNKLGSDTLTEKDKHRAVILMAFDPLINQALYYFGIRVKLPETARKLNKIGWKIFGIFMLPAVIGVVVLVLLLTAGGVQSKAWYAKNYTTLQAGLQTINDDFANNSEVANSNDLTVAANACKKVGTDADALKSIPPYPNQDIAKKIAAGIDSISKGANDCFNGITNKDLDTLTKAGTEIDDGTQQLTDGIKAIQTEHDAKK